MAMNFRPPKAYFDGKNARMECRDIESCPETDNVKAAWWRAGWHDADMEAGNRWTLQH